MALRLLTTDNDAQERLLAARAGDPAAREWLVRTHTPAVYRFCLRMLRDEQDAADVAQETMLRVLRNLERYDPERPFTTWMFAIARNASIDETRRRRKEGPPPELEPADPGPSPAELTSRTLRARRLESALAELSPMYREVLVLYHFEHLKYQEIADTLGIPLGTVMNRIFRARRALRALYGEETETHA